MTIEIKTHDTDFACALMSRGARLASWQTNEDRTRVEWHLTEVEGQWVEDFRSGSDGFAAFVHARRMLLNIAKTETKPDKRK